MRKKLSINFHSFPHLRQSDSRECGGTCLRMIALHYGRVFSAEAVRRICIVGHNGISMQNLNEAAQKMGFHTVCGRMNMEKLIEVRPFPCILFWNQNHFVVLYKISKKRNGKCQFHIADPARTRLSISQDDFLKCWCGEKSVETQKGIIMVLKPTTEFYKQRNEAGNGYSLAFLRKYLKGYAALFVQLTLGLILGSLLQLAFPFLTQAIVDKGIEQKNLHLIYLILVGQFMLVLGRTAIDFIRRWLLLHISVRINIALLSDFFFKLMKLPLSFFDSKLKGDLLQRVNDHQRLEQFITAQSLNTLFSLCSFFIFGGVLCIYSHTIFLIFLTGGLLYALWILGFLQKRKLLDYEFFDLYAKQQSKSMQIIEGMQDIKLQNCEKRKRWEWEETRADLFDAHIESLKLQQIQEGGSLFINEMKNILITVVTATSVVNGELTLGMMLSIQYIIGQLNSPIDQLVQLVYHWQDVRLSIERISEIHKKEDENIHRFIRDEECKHADITLENVTFFYNGQPLPALKHINLHIPYGKTTAIVGASGSGKTTLIKLLLGFYKPSEGNIRIGKYDLNTVDLQFWRSLCGTVLQDGYLFSESVARNIATRDEVLDMERIKEATKLANIDDMIEKLPMKYETVIGDDGQGLSQGQRQRVLIARAIYKRPEFLFFDEATNALDTANEREIVKHLTDFAYQRTFVVVAHRLSTVQHADCIIVMDNGEIVEKGTHKELIELKGTYYHLVKEQLQLGE